MCSNCIVFQMIIDGDIKVAENNLNPMECLKPFLSICWAFVFMGVFTEFGEIVTDPIQVVSFPNWGSANGFAFNRKHSTLNNYSTLWKYSLCTRNIQSGNLCWCKNKFVFNCVHLWFSYFLALRRIGRWKKNRYTSHVGAAAMRKKSVQISSTMKMSKFQHKFYLFAKNDFSWYFLEFRSSLTM